MYFFVRYTGYVLILFGIFLMLAGLAGTILGFVQPESLLSSINEGLNASNSLWRLSESQNESGTRFLTFLTSLLGLSMFVSGMVVAALGQLLLVFADLASHARETNILLRSFRSRQRRPAPRLTKPSRYEGDEPVG